MSIRNAMAGPAYARLQKSFNAQLDAKENDVFEIMEEVGRDAATEMKHNIAYRGVKDTIPNFDGRIKTGAMEEAIDYEVQKIGDHLQLRVGWLPNRPREKYWSWQEGGTRAWGQPMGNPDPRAPEERENRGIRPMFAVKDANDHAAVELRARFHQ